MMFIGSSCENETVAELFNRDWQDDFVLEDLSEPQI